MKKEEENQYRQQLSEMDNMDNEDSEDNCELFTGVKGNQSSESLQLTECML